MDVHSSFLGSYNYNLQPKPNLGLGHDESVGSSYRYLPKFLLSVWKSFSPFFCYRIKKKTFIYLILINLIFVESIKKNNDWKMVFIRDALKLWFHQENISAICFSGCFGGLGRHQGKKKKQTHNIFFKLKFTQNF